MVRWLDAWRSARDPRRRDEKSPDAQDPPSVHVRILNPWHAVSIEPGEESCEAVCALQDQRFLSSGTPPLIPLKDCDASRCTCRYRHHDDRRAGTGISDPFKPLQPHPLRRRTDAPSF
jgi:hypothetical protein